VVFDVLVVRYLHRNGLRSLVAVAAVALAVAIAVAVATVNATAGASFASAIATSSDEVNLQIFGSGRRLSETVIAPIRQVPGVIRVEPILEAPLVLAARTGTAESESLTVVGADLLQRLPRDAEFRATLPGPYAPSGSAPSFEDLVVDGGAIISARFAAQRSLTVGSRFSGRINGRTVTLRVAAVLSPAVADIDSSVVFVDIAVAQDLTGMTGFIQRVDATVALDSIAEVSHRIEAVLPAGDRVIVRRPDDALAGLMRRFRFSLLAVSAMAFVVASLLIYNGVALSVVQRRADVAILRRLGVHRSAIFRAFVLEGALIGVVGAAEGLAFSTFLVWVVVGRALGATAGTLPYGVVYDLRAMLIATLAGVGIAVASAIWPARAAARIAAQTEMGVSRSRAERTDRRLLGLAVAIVVAGVIAWLFGLARTNATAGLAVAGAVVAALACVPAALRQLALLARDWVPQRFPEARFAASHLAAVPRPTAIVLGSVVVAIAMLVTAAVTVASFRTAVDTWASSALPGDLLVRLDDGLGGGASSNLSARDLSRIRSRNGVASADAIVDDRSALRGSTVVNASAGTDVIALRARVIESVAPTIVTLRNTRELRTRISTIFAGTFIVAYALCALALAIAIVGMANTLAASVLERKLEIGLLRYLGLRRTAVRRMILTESGTIGVLACALGVSLGAIVAGLLIEGTPDTNGAMLGLIFPSFPVLLIAVSAAAAILVAGIYPGRVASQIRTDHVVHVE
jgi:putative ABC transport system permease protein